MRKAAWLIGLFTIGTVEFATAAPQPAAAKPSGLVKVERAASTLFKNADADKNGTLSQAEFKKIERPLANKIRDLTADPQVEKAVFAAHVLEPDKQPPVLNGNEAITATDFTDHVLGELGTIFTRQNPQPVANPFVRAGNNNANNFAQPMQPMRNSRRDDETPSQQRDRERREEQDRQRQAQQQQYQRQLQAAQERDSFRPTPPPRESSGGSGRESGAKVGFPGGFPGMPANKR